MLRHLYNTYNEEDFQNTVTFENICKSETKELIVDSFKFRQLSGTDALREFKKIIKNDFKLKKIKKLFLNIENEQLVSVKRFQNL